MEFISILRGWIGLVGLMALGNTISCFKGHKFLGERLYTGAPESVNGLMARVFGVWTLLAAILRVYCAMHIHNIQIYNLTLVSFILAFLHFACEVCVYQTARLTIGVITPLIISSVSIIIMMIGYAHV